MSLHRPILRCLLTHPRRTLMTDDNRSYKGIEVLVASLHMAGQIQRVCKSKTVGILLPTGGAFPIAALGAWILGKTVVPLNYLLKREELTYVIGDCETDTIISAGPMLEYLGYRPEIPNLIEMDTVRFKGFPPLRFPAAAADDDLAVLLYTSGTSGKPKGVMLTHGNLTSNIQQCIDHVHFTSEEVMLGVLPQFHSFGLTVLTLLPLTLGCRVVYSARFIPQRIIKLIREHKPTAFVAIPSMYNALMVVKGVQADDFDSVKYIVSGGEPLPDAVFQSFKEKFGKIINEGYGLTETSPVTHWCRPGEWRAHSVGPALPRMGVKIKDPTTGAVLGPDTDGEVVMKGPNVMKGYFKLPAETAATFDAEGYFKTGDMGRVDKDGFLYITGRIKEMLIIGGENVFPREIEEVLNRHPAVNASGVIGIHDPMRGELPLAFVELKEGQTTDEKSLKIWCRESLAGYKVPSEIRIIPALPRNPTGKIMRRELKKLV
ncbi:MAG: AMP-binding protein [Phycisphaeraceae bacterium]|nr:AMP-binding protein [Phycisphaeraceae bacterium]